MSNTLNKQLKPAGVKKEPFAGDEMSEIQHKLDKQLGPEYVSARPGGGGVKVSYIEGWKAINLANQVFGFNGWNSEVKAVQVDYLDTVAGGKFNVGLSVTVRVTLKDGCFHEDIGYGSCDNARSKAMAFEKAKKEAMTDGMKRALRCFGNAMGNCLYDKDYLNKISKVKCAPPDFDESNLMRFTDIVQSRTNSLGKSATGSTPVQQASSSSLARNPLSTGAVAKQTSPRKAYKRANEGTDTSNGTNTNLNNENEDLFDDSLTFSDDINPEDDLDHPQREEREPDAMMVDQTPSKEVPSDTRPTEVGFFKARVAEQVQKQSPLATSHAFNPSFISPSIRRTVDPTKSTPIKRSLVQPEKPAAARYDDPQSLPNRQIGKPRYPPPKKTKILEDSNIADS